MSSSSWRHYKLPGTAPTPRRLKKPVFAISKSDAAADAIIFQCRAAALPIPTREYLFAAPDRKWRFDLAWPDHQLALEFEGLVFPTQPRWQDGPAEHRLSGRHASVTGFLADLEKYGDAFARGWSVLRATHKQVEIGMVLHWLERRFKALP
ncbi:MAG TPA: hypothetical protein VFD81_10440 [Methylomirabilota bacterium]|nr:hypothetical protein [Methylomirabilota bacterium]